MSVSRLKDDEYVPPPELMSAWDEHPEIVKLGAPVLRAIASPVTRILTGETQRLIQHLKTVVQKANGLGLAAPQLGVSQRIIVLHVHDEVEVIVNPVISGGRGSQDDPLEGCLSIPGLHGRVKRFEEIRIRGQDNRGRPISRKVTELEARVIQHEVDHLDGILFIDRADPETIDWAGSNEDDESPGERE